MDKQYTAHLLMVRPACFQFNTETALSNAFQKNISELDVAQIKEKAIAEFDNYVNTLRSHGINVTVIQDTRIPAKPDAIFPNNWISMDKDGTVFLFPMLTPNRRLEVRSEIIDILKQKYFINEIKDFTFYVNENKFLEGTGSMIFDHINKIVYACLSPRTNKNLLVEYCMLISYKPIYFSASDEQQNLVYHTNVMLTIGDKFAVICLDSIIDKSERNTVVQQLENDGHEIINISFAQMGFFAGNMLQVQSEDGKTFLVMSQTAFDSLTSTQIAQIKKYTSILSVQIPTIETIGGGSARCMLAEIYLPGK